MSSYVGTCNSSLTPLQQKKAAAGVSRRPRRPGGPLGRVALGGKPPALHPRRAARGSEEGAMRQTPSPDTNSNVQVAALL